MVLMKNKHLTGGLFDGRGKPQTLKPSAKAKRIITPEKNIQASFIAWRNIHKRQFPILNAIFAVPNGLWAQNGSVAAAQVLQGLTAGIPDIIVLAPSADRKFHALCIEFKTEVGKVSEEQKFFLEFFAKVGIRCEVSRSAYEASVIVNEHLGIKVPIYPR